MKKLTKSINFAVNIQQNKDCTMMILLAWGIFIGLVYLLLYCDFFYYRYNLPKACKKVLDAFTEEE